jgi:hypothetical protein
LAVGAKETGFAAICMVCLLLPLAQFPLREKFVPLAAIMLITLFAILMRLYALGGFSPTALVRESHFDEIIGVAYQVIAFGGSLKHFILSLSAMLVCVLIFCMLVYVAWRNENYVSAIRTPRTERNCISRPALVGGLLALLCSVLFVQAPIAKFLFENPANAQGSNLRFFYLPIGVVLCTCIVAVSGDRLPTVKRIALWFWCVPLVLFAYDTSQYSENWNRYTRDEAMAIQATETALKKAANASNESHTLCYIRFDPRTSIKPYVNGFLDAAVKARAPRGDSTVDCLLITDPPQAFSLTRLFPCSNATIKPLASNIDFAAPLDRSGTCSYLQVTYR